MVEPVPHEPQQRVSYDARTRLSKDERRQLAEKYAPVLVLFPEDHDLGRPAGGDHEAPKVRGDYHPRPVDLVLDHAYVYSGLRGHLRRPHQLIDFNQGHPLIRHLPNFIRRHFPEPDPNAQERLPEIVRGDVGIALASVLDLVGLGRGKASAQRAWDRYFQILNSAENGRYHPCVYARVLQGDEVIEWTWLDRLRWYSDLLGTIDETVRESTGPFAQVANEIEAFLDRVEESIGEFVTGLKRIEGNPYDVAVQYWFLYYYNDWYNRHEVDWESITVILQGDEDAPVTPANLTPEIAGYSSHTAGRRRPWVTVRKAGDRPLVYCARGSHASYFGFREEGYSAGFPVSIKIPWINFSITGHIKRAGFGFRDWVADSSDSPFHVDELCPWDDYELQLLPNLDPRRRRYDEEDLETLSWLIYPGLWGDRPLFSIGGSGPQGPLWQGVKSDNPFEWVRRVCEADDMYSP